MNIPVELAPLFKNYDLSSMELERSADVIIHTVLTRGSLEQISLLFQLYGFTKIKEIFCNDFFGLRTLPAPTTSLWSLPSLLKKNAGNISRGTKIPTSAGRRAGK